MSYLIVYCNALLNPILFFINWYILESCWRPKKRQLEKSFWHSVCGANTTLKILVHCGVIFFFLKQIRKCTLPTFKTPREYRKNKTLMSWQWRKVLFSKATKCFKVIGCVVLLWQVPLTKLSGTLEVTDSQGNISSKGNYNFSWILTLWILIKCKTRQMLSEKKQATTILAFIFLF